MQFVVNFLDTCDLKQVSARLQKIRGRRSEDRKLLERDCQTEVNN